MNIEAINKIDRHFLKKHISKILKSQSMPTKKKKHPKMDKLLVSKEKHELKYTAKKAGTSQKKVVEAKKKVGRSRKKIMKELK